MAYDLFLFVAPAWSGSVQTVFMLPAQLHAAVAVAVETLAKNILFIQMVQQQNVFIVYRRRERSGYDSCSRVSRLSGQASGGNREDKRLTLETRTHHKTFHLHTYSLIFLFTQ